MLVNAHDYPAAAMFQGIGMIVAAIWVFWYTNRPYTSRKQSEEEKEAIKRVLEANAKLTKEVLLKRFDRVE